MTTKHQPATPLPWTATCTAQEGPVGAYRPVPGIISDAPLLPNGYLRVVRASCASKRGVQDILYITHVSLAYPRLVKALRLTMQGCEHSTIEYQSAEKLLLDLGEDT